MTPDEIAVYVMALIQEFGMEPDEINDGWCDDFADKLAIKIKAAALRMCMPMCASMASITTLKHQPVLMIGDSCRVFYGTLPRKE